MSTCKHCSQSFDKKDIANHSRWCTKNPKRSTYQNDMIKARSSIKNPTNQYIKAKQEGRKIIVSKETRHKIRIKALGRSHTEETKRIISEKALASPHRRLRKNPIEYNGVMLDSTWELVLAKRLDSLGVRWIRPEPLKWTDQDGIEHNYFPDFYLIDHDMYLDPKNPHACDVQANKISFISKLYRIRFLTTIEECDTFLP